MIETRARRRAKELVEELKRSVECSPSAAPEGQKPSDAFYFCRTYSKRARGRVDGTDATLVSTEPLYLRTAVNECIMPALCTVTSSAVLVVAILELA
jgi:hypothetical protein